MLIKVLKNIDNLPDTPYKNLKAGDEIELDILQLDKREVKPLDNYVKEDFDFGDYSDYFIAGKFKLINFNTELNDKAKFNVFFKSFLIELTSKLFFNILGEEIKKNIIKNEQNSKNFFNTRKPYIQTEIALNACYAKELADKIKPFTLDIFTLFEYNSFLKFIIPRIEDVLKDLQQTKKTTQQRLFNNEIDSERAFGINRVFSDNLNKLTNKITPETAEESFKYNGKIFKHKDEDLALKVIDTGNQIQTAEQFYKALERIKSGKVLQTLLALWYYANKQGNFIFSGTRLNKIMQTLLKTKTGNYTQEQKRAFTEAIHRLRDFEIFLDQTITDTDDKGRKQKVIKRDFYKLIDLVGATYAKRKKDVIDPETGRVIKAKGTADESVIIKLYGELLPRFNKGIMRGRLYSRGLLELDANKDERAILLGFKLLTRFDQLRQGAKGKDLVSDNNLYIETDRKTLIEWADYIKTDLEDKWTANKHLIKTLDKLIEINCLRNYEPKKLTTSDDLKITLYPSEIALKPPVKDDQTIKIEAPKPEKKENKGQTNWSNLPVEKQKKEFKKYLLNKGRNEKTANKMTANKFKNGFCF